VRSDSARLSQVISNLLDNAAKYTEPGGHIHLSVDREGPDVLVVVRDSGMGISPEQLPKIFDPFIQLSPSGAGEGLGIGLTLVKQLVELHGGRVAARSAGVGAGSEFIVRLPAQQVSAALVASPPAEATRKPPSEIHLRILVVDDNVYVAKAITRLLRACGHDVRVAYDGQAAIEAAADFTFDVALLDLAIPRVNGLEVARQLRVRHPGRSMLLIAMTGFGQESDRKRTALAGFDHHFTKPVGIDTLQEVMSAWWIANGRRSAAADAASEPRAPTPLDVE
jgi:CheY-like chemotaxis protein